ncbi:MAG: hypothetical protein SGILL_009713, partial [Bacillariaceae sp.]
MHERIEEASPDRSAVEREEVSRSAEENEQPKGEDVINHNDDEDFIIPSKKPRQWLLDR